VVAGAVRFRCTYQYIQNPLQLQSVGARSIFSSIEGPRGQKFPSRVQGQSLGDGLQAKQAGDMFWK